MNIYDVPKKTQQDLLDEKEYKDFAENVELNMRGMPNHLLVGHGMDTQQFERRDIVQTSKLFMEEKKVIKEIIKPTEFRKDNTDKQKIQVNNRAADIPAFLKADPGELKPRGYNEFSKKFDANYMKLGLRK